MNSSAKQMTFFNSHCIGDTFFDVLYFQLGKTSMGEKKECDFFCLPNLSPSDSASVVTPGNDSLLNSLQFFLDSSPISL